MTGEGNITIQENPSKFSVKLMTHEATPVSLEKQAKSRWGVAMSRSRFFHTLASFAAVVVLGGAPAVSFAGMPAPLPDDIETVLRFREEPVQRLQVISFFLLGLLLSALFVKWIWNSLRREFPRLPRISFGKSLLLTIAWGLLFCIVLVMISGARELMTPGAWKKTGATYQLKEDPQPTNKAGQP